MDSIYRKLPGKSFWRTAVTEANPHELHEVYDKKFSISAEAKIATAGSCFAQHITRYLRAVGYHVLDTETAPPGLPPSLHHKYGFSMYSARYGNIYSVRQMLQLVLETAKEHKPQNFIWKKGDRYFDALRPAVEPYGFGSPNDVLIHRKDHVSAVKSVFLEMDVFIFTLGLSEVWVDPESGTVFPTAPGTIIGNCDDNLCVFKNLSFLENFHDLECLIAMLLKLRSGRPFNVLLTVSPVPLTATASGKHVLVANSLSKSVLRAVAGELVEHTKNVDYFPAYELVTNPRLHSVAFEPNLRSVRQEYVTFVMKHFLKSHYIKGDGILEESKITMDGDVQCEEALMEDLS
jgi:hypothetical protein